MQFLSVYQSQFRKTTIEQLRLRTEHIQSNREQLLFKSVLIQKHMVQRIRHSLMRSQKEVWQREIL